MHTPPFTPKERRLMLFVLLLFIAAHIALNCQIKSWKEAERVTWVERQQRRAPVQP